MKIFNKKKKEPICQSCQNLMWYNKHYYKCAIFHIWGDKEDCPIWCKDYKKREKSDENKENES